MSLINNMLAGLEDRQAYMSEGRDIALEGLTSVNDDNFLQTGKKSSLNLVLFLSLSIGILLFVYLYYPGFNEETDIISAEPATRNEIPTDGPAATTSNDAGVPDRSSQRAATVPDQQTRQDAGRISLKMDFNVPVTTGAVTPDLSTPTAVTQEPAAAQNVDTIIEPAITSYDVNFMEGVGSVVKLIFNESAAYRVYELDKPYRVVAEFDKYLSLPGELPTRFEHGVVANMRGHHSHNNNRTMVVFDLNEQGLVQLSEIRDTQAGHELTLYISPAKQTVDLPESAVTANTTVVDAPAVEEVYKQKGGTLSVTRNNSTPDQLLGKGVSDFQKGKTREGLEQIAKALDLEPLHTQARSTLVNLLIKQNNISRAITVLDEGIVLMPEQFDWRELKAKLLVKLNRNNDAIETLISSGPEIESNPEYYAFLAALLQQQGRNEEAAGYYQNAVAARGDNGVWWMGLGISLERTGNSEQAAIAYQNAIKDNSLSPDIRNYIKNRLSINSRP